MTIVETNQKDELRSPREKRWRRRLLAVCAVLLIAGVAAALHLIPVERLVPAKGYIISRQQTQLRPLLPGTVSSIHLADGQSITAGQPIIELDATKAAAELKLAEAHRDALKKAKDRDLSEEARASRRTLAELRVKIAAVNVERHTVTARHDGVLQLNPLSVGETVGPERLLGEVFSHARQAKLRVNENYLSKLEVGQRVILQLTAKAGKEVETTILHVGGVVRADRRSGYVEVICDLEETDIPVGSTCQASIAIGPGSLLDRILAR